MTRIILVFILIGWKLFASLGQTSNYDQYILREKLPTWTINTFKKHKLDSIYQFADFINPFYLEADFNNDNYLDAAIAIDALKTKMKGIILLHGTSDKFYVFGAGTEFGNGGDNFDWMDVWKVYRAKELFEMTFDQKGSVPVNFNGTGLLVEKSESASGVIYWDGQKYRWAQTSD